MTKEKESKLSILIVVFATAFILVLLILVGGKSSHHVDAEHFAIQQGYMFDEYFADYKAAAVVDFMNQVYGEEEVNKDIEGLFTTKIEGKEVVDLMKIESLKSITETEVVKTASNQILDNYNEALSHLKTDAEKNEFKKELHLRLKGFLLNYHKDVIRHESSNH